MVENEADATEVEPLIRFVGDLGRSTNERVLAAESVVGPEAADRRHVSMCECCVAWVAPSRGTVDKGLLTGVVSGASHQLYYR